MRKLTLIPLLFLALAGCGKSPENLAAEALKAGDRAKALLVLNEAKAKKPEYKPTRYLLFVLDEYLVSQGEPAKHDAYLTAAIDEYSWIAKQEGLSADYKDMDGSLKSNDKTRPAYEAAYTAVYAR